MTTFSKKTVFVLVCCSSSSIFADDLLTAESNKEYFDPIFLNLNNNTNIDLSKFNHDTQGFPGTYLAEIYVNNMKIGREDVNLVEQSDKTTLPCLSLRLIQKINFDYSKLPSDFSKKIIDSKTCVYLKTVLPESTINFDSNTQQLDIFIPQAYMQDSARGYVSPELWDSGIKSAFLGYTLNAYNNKLNDKTYNSAFGSFNAGINIGSWYFRHEGNYNWQEERNSHYQSLNTYVQKDIPSINSRVILGESNTSGQLFNTVPFIGGQLNYVNQMLPQSKRGYAPDIRGIARTNAQVIIRQNGRVIYEKTVPPGPFNITDLFPTGYGGDLNVSVNEADGTIQEFEVPYASITQLLRPGMYHYDIAVGKLDDNNLSSKPELYQATYRRGLTNWVTGYTGIQASKNYTAIQLGSAISTSIGAFSADITHSNTHLNSDYIGQKNGQSYQLSFSKYIRETKSNLNIAAYRYSTSGYMDYLTAMYALDAEQNKENNSNILRTKNRFTITLNQSLPKNFGQLYVTGYSQNYWNNDQSDVQYQFGYSNHYNKLNYNLSASRVRNGLGDIETNFLLSLTMPLSGTNQKNTPQITSNISHNQNGRTGAQLGLSGAAGAENQYSYGLSRSSYNRGQGTNVNLNGQYNGPLNNVFGTYSLGDHYQSASLGVSGTVLAWKDGIVMTPHKGDTFAIIDAPGAAGAKVGGYLGTKLNRWGLAAIPYLNPYEMNEITIDPKGTSYHVELDTTSQKVAPYQGAIVLLKYKTNIGYPLLISTDTQSSERLPFGSDVFDSKGNIVGSVGQMGQVYVRVQNKQDVLSVKWGNQNNQQCSLSYHVKAEDYTKNTEPSLIRMQQRCLLNFGVENEYAQHFE